MLDVKVLANFFLIIIMSLGFIGSFATLIYEPRQDRKVATVVDLKCAEDVLMKSFFCLNFMGINFYDNDNRQTRQKN